MESANSSVVKPPQVSPPGDAGRASNTFERPERRGEIIARLAAEIRSLRGDERVLASVELPAALVDEVMRHGMPMLRNAAAVCGASGIGLIAVGLWGGSNAGRRTKLHNRRRRDCLRQAARTVRYQGGTSARPRFFGGSRFAPSGTVRDSAWDAFGGWRFILPEIIIAIESRGLASGTITVALSASDTACDIGGKSIARCPLRSIHGAVSPGNH